MEDRSKYESAGGGEAGTPAEPPPAARGNTSRRYPPAERRALLDELARSGETLAVFCARKQVSTATICAWRRALRAHGEAGLIPREPRRNADGHTGRQRDPEERRNAVEAFQRSGLKLEQFARTWGVSPWTLRIWLTRYNREGPKGLEPRKRGRPRGSGGGFRSVAPAARTEIVRTHTRFPTFGLKKIRDFLARFQGVSVSTGTVARTLERAGVERTRTRTKRRPKSHLPRRFERARPGELWQTDITSFLLRRHHTRVYLVVFLDDHSRFIVGHVLATHQKGDMVCEALMEAIARFGKPKEVLSDQGRQYFAWRGKSEFQRLLVREGIAHVVARTHHPQTVGKCERLWETIGREFWERARPEDLADARERLAHFLAHYNFFRPHQGIDGLVPADRFFGAQDALRKTLEAQLSAHELDAALEQTPRKSVYLFGQVGDEQVSMLGERGELVVQTSSGVRTRMNLDELGAPAGARKETIDEDRDERVTHDGPGHGADALQERDAPTAHGQEAAEVSTAAQVSARSEGALELGHARGAGACAQGVHADPLAVAGQEAARGGVGGACDPAAARVAAQPAGAGGNALGPPASTPTATREPGDDDGDEGRRSARAEEAGGSAGAQALGQGSAAATSDRAAEAQGRAADVGGVGGEDENARTSSTTRG